ncbi:MAG: PTS sugar transporter subunit IIC [Bacilli bacterium]|nr:PTS sugar transporter subunit IIC [Bacilli bacterium]
MEENGKERREQSKIIVFLKKYGKKLLDYLIKTMNGMAFGLFSTLIIGVIIHRIGILLNVDAIVELAKTLMGLMGIGIGIGIAWSLKLDGLRLIVAGVSGGIATFKFKDPLVAYLCVIGSIEILNLILRKKTPVDIIIIPLLSSFVAYGITLLIGEPVSSAMTALGNFIERATTLQPLFMGIIIAVIMGMALTAPISSAAIATAIGIGGLAGGAAVVGCCVQMLGFAVMSRKDNNIGMVLSVAFGTSMLQFKNILRKPVIWVPTIVVSAILGPLSTLVFKTECISVGAGMGTSGLVGQFATFDAMGATSGFYWSLIVLEFILPIVLVFIVDVIFRKLKIIKPGDLKI